MNIESYQRFERIFAIVILGIFAAITIATLVYTVRSRLGG